MVHHFGKENSCTFIINNKRVALKPMTILIWKSISRSKKEPENSDTLPPFSLPPKKVIRDILYSALRDNDIAKDTKTR